MIFASSIFKSLSEPARIRILFLLYCKEELCISDLQHILDYTQAKTSRHLTYLKNAGLVISNKEDQWVFYRINEDVMPLLNKLFQFFSKDNVLQKDIDTYETLYSNRELARNRIERRRYQMSNTGD